MGKKQQLSKAEKDYIRAIVEETIPKAADEAVKRAFISAAEKKQADRKALFKQTEDMLRAKEIMEENIIEWKQELDRLELGISEKHTASDIVAIANTRLTPEQLLESKIISLQAKIERDQEKLHKLENALETIIDDKWYPIIEMKYFQEWEDEDIAEELNCDKRTIWRHKSRLIWKLAIKLFGGELIG